MGNLKKLEVSSLSRHHCCNPDVEANVQLPKYRYQEEKARIAFEANPKPTDDKVPFRSSLVPLNTYTPPCSLDNWAGDTWRAVATILKHRPDIRAVIVPAGPTGIVVLAGMVNSSEAAIELRSHVHKSGLSDQIVSELARWTYDTVVDPALKLVLNTSSDACREEPLQRCQREAPLASDSAGSFRVPQFSFRQYLVRNEERSVLEMLPERLKGS